MRYAHTHSTVPLEIVPDAGVEIQRRIYCFLRAEQYTLCKPIRAHRHASVEPGVQCIFGLRCTIV